MEAILDNTGNILSTKIRARHDPDSVIYTVNTEQSLWRGRIVTYLKDKNPLGGDSKSVVVGAINWKKKTFEITGVRHKLEDVRRKVGEFGKKKTAIWKWANGYEEYELVHREGGWEATCQRTGKIEAKLLVPYRPHLFGKQPPIELELSRVALAKDEVFLILAIIYSEAKRQERMTLVE